MITADIALDLLMYHSHVLIFDNAVFVELNKKENIKYACFHRIHLLISKRLENSLISHVHVTL